MSDRAKMFRSNGDVDVAAQLFYCGMVWDGNLASKSSRDHFVRHGYAVKAEGYQSLTGLGVIGCFTSPRFLWGMFKRWRSWKRNPFIASKDQIKRALR
jgi:hypothetical protein